MLRKSFRTHLKAAANEAQVLSVVARFLSEWRPGEVALLPPGAWPIVIRSPRDVLAHSAALGAMHARFTGNVASLQALQEMLLFFTQAAVRLAALAALEAQGDCPGPLRAHREPGRAAHRSRGSTPKASRTRH